MRNEPWRRRAWLFTTILAVLALGAVACNGGDDGDSNEPEIRIQKGLAVAAASENIGRSSDTTGESSEDLAAPSAPGTDGAAADSDVARTGPYSPLPDLAAQQSTDGITVSGYGSASADPDSAIIEFYFGRNGGGVSPAVPETRSSDSTSGSGSSEPVTDVATLAQQETAPITEADLQPVIDAIVGAGVAREDIEFIGQSYYDPYFASATLRVTVRDVNAVDDVVTAARNAVGGVPNTQLQSTNVSYTLQDCSALEKAAMGAAVEDAGERAQVLAEVLGAGIGPVTGASNYSYSPYGGTPCDTGYFGPYPLGGIAYTEGQTNEVTVFAQVNVTHAIQ